MRRWWKRFWHWCRYFKCDLCLEEKRRPGYETRDQMATICFECAWVHDEL